MIPPLRFAYVEKDLFRGAYPIESNYAFMRTLHLKTIVSMIPAETERDLPAFCEKEHINLVKFAVPKASSKIFLSHSTIQSVLKVVCDPSNLPCYIHCLDGRYNTGIVIMCLRKLEMWQQKNYLAEYEMFTGPSELGEGDFVANFSWSYVFNQSIPRWLNHLKGKDPHPTMDVWVIEDGDNESEKEYEYEYD